MMSSAGLFRSSCELSPLPSACGSTEPFSCSSSLGCLGSFVLHGNLLLDRLLIGQLAGHLLKLFDAGKLVDVFQTEAEEEVLGCLVEDGAADDLLAACRGDELAGHQGAENAAGVDAADLGDLRRGNGLLVGDDGEGFERLQGELQGRLERFDEAADGVVVLGLGGEAVTAGDLANLEAAVAGGVVGDELVEDGAEVLAQAASLLLVLFGLASSFLVGGLFGGRCAFRLWLGGGGFSLGVEGVACPHGCGVRDGVLMSSLQVGGLFGGCCVQGVVESLRALDFGEHFVVQGVGVRRLLIQRQGLLGGGLVVQFGLSLVAEEPDELGEGYRFFRGVDDCFDLCFKAHSLDWCTPKHTNREGLIAMPRV